MYILGVQIPSQQVFGCLGSQTLCLLSFFLRANSSQKAGLRSNLFIAARHFCFSSNFGFICANFKFIVVGGIDTSD